MLPSSVLIRLHAEYCRAIANEARLAILYELAEGERSVGELAAALGLSTANVSQHLRRMRTAGAVSGRRDGHTVYYFAADPKLMAACRLIREALVERHAADTALMEHLELGPPPSG
ncbi:MAG: winged helix-turn-helix transcriptional regulator [Thermoleophilia bacterium]|nr:winged helix-turn-helix transcriptional regulator [Thermoleophilia bacterium]